MKNEDEKSHFFFLTFLNNSKVRRQPYKHTSFPGSGALYFCPLHIQCSQKLHKPLYQSSVTVVY